MNLRSAQVFRGVIHKERVGSFMAVASKHSLKHHRVRFSGFVVGGCKHVFPEERNELWCYFGQMLTDQNSVVREQRDLTKLFRKGNRFGYFWSVGHGVFAEFHELLTGDVPSKSLVHEPKVFVPGVRLASFSLPLTVVMPPPLSQFLKIKTGESGELLHPVAPAVFIEDVVHVKDKKHDALSLGGKAPRSGDGGRTRLNSVPAQIIDCQNVEQRALGISLAHEAVSAGHSIVIPTDTVYGVGCDAFSPAAVAGLLALKGRGRHMPPPVLVGAVSDVDRLVAEVPESARAVMEQMWPGGVTIILKAHPDVSWDLGDTGGTVAIRMPDNDIALELLAKTGPLAVSSANISGQPAAISAKDAFSQLGGSVAVYLDGGIVGPTHEGPHNPGSTIVDASDVADGGPWRVVRQGVVPSADIQAIATGRWEA